MDSIKIRELEEKSLVDSDNTMIVEDNTGTLQVPVSSLQKSLQASLYCQTVDDMKKSGFNEGDVVCTLGYHSINDGGAATYIIENNPTAVGDDMTLISLLTSDVLKARLVYDKFVSPIQCGAYGDGVHDDSKVIQALIYANIPLKFPKKTFCVSLKINNTNIIDFNGCTLRGIDYFSDIITSYDYQSQNNLVLRNINFLCGPIVWLHYNYKVSIDNCTFSMDSKFDGYPYIPNTVVRFSGVKYATISNCVFNDNTVKKNSLIELSDATGTVNIINCIFNNAISTPVRVLGCNNAVISKSIFNTAENAKTSYSFYDIESGSQKLSINDCYINNTEYNVQAFLAAYDDAAISISNTSFTNMGRFGNLNYKCKVVFDKLNSINMNSLSENKYIFDSVHADATVDICGLVFYDTYEQSREKPVYPYNYYNGRNVKGKIHSCILNYSPTLAMPIPITDSAMSLYIDSILANDSTVKKPMYCTTNIAIFLQYDKYAYINNIYNAIDGQVLVVYGNTNCYLNNGNGNIDVPNEDGTYSKIYLSEIKPIILKYNMASGKWKKLK